MTESILTPEEVQAEFSTWRSNKIGHCPIPDELWDKVRSLLGKYPQARVLRALKLTTSQARSKGLIPSKIKSNADILKKATFVKVPVVESMLQGATSELILTSKNGDHQVSMKNPSPEHIKIIIDRFLG